MARRYVELESRCDAKMASTVISFSRGRAFDDLFNFGPGPQQQPATGTAAARVNVHPLSGCVT